MDIGLDNQRSYPKERNDYWQEKRSGDANYSNAQRTAKPIETLEVDENSPAGQAGKKKKKKKSSLGP